MLKDFSKISLTLSCGEKIANAEEWEDLEALLKDRKLPLQKRWDIETLKQLSKENIDSAKDMLLFDVVFRELHRTYRHRKLDTTNKKKRCGKIANVFNVIDTKKRDFHKLQIKYDVGINILIQHKRFDPYPERGKIKTGTINGIKRIWREPD